MDDISGEVVGPVGFFESGFGRAVLVGCVVGFVCTTSLTTLIVWLAGAGLAAAAAVGAFAGLWGGPGFGGMMGATLHASRRHSWLPDATATAPSASVSHLPSTGPAVSDRRAPVSSANPAA